MNTLNSPKYLALKSYLRDKEKVAVAFSGGVDSSFLLAAARDAIGEQVVGITIYAPSLPESELEDAINIAQKLEVRHIILKSEEIEDEIRMNPVNRCYFCKKIEYGEIKKEAASLGIVHVVDGSNADDLKDYRPGMKARDEIQVSSPLQELGITKEEIRDWLKEMNLPVWDKPAAACLYSRIPYGKEIKREDLRKVELAERLLATLGFRQVRVRCHDDLARIEVSAIEIPRLVQEPLRSTITTQLKSFGFNFVTLDIQGYRMGSFNPLPGLANAS
jgi:pyridinium-3,5-biscarboxylic acid mononucleotide sulfurtransferase